MKFPLKIIEHTPSTWKELQELVAQILSDCGFQTEIEKTIITLRGKVEVDVYAEKVNGFHSKVLCECKYWNGNIPQSVVHSFRSVLGDYGASQGFIISKIGFQKGAYEAAFKSNMCLLNWDEFQQKFEPEWLKQIVERNYKAGKKLMDAVIKVIDIYHKNTKALEDQEFANFQQNREDYSNFLFYTFKEHYFDTETNEISKSEVEDRISSYKNNIPIVIKSLSDYFNFIFEKCNRELLNTSDIHQLIQNRIDKKKK